MAQWVVCLVLLVLLAVTAGQDYREDITKESEFTTDTSNGQVVTGPCGFGGCHGHYGMRGHHGMSHGHHGMNHGHHENHVHQWDQEDLGNQVNGGNVDTFGYHGRHHGGHGHHRGHGHHGGHGHHRGHRHHGGFGRHCSHDHHNFHTFRSNTPLFNAQNPNTRQVVGAGVRYGRRYVVEQDNIATTPPNWR